MSIRPSQLLNVQAARLISLVTQQVLHRHDDLSNVGRLQFPTFGFTVRIVDRLVYQRVGSSPQFMFSDRLLNDETMTFCRFIGIVRRPTVKTMLRLKLNIRPDMCSGCYLRRIRIDLLMRSFQHELGKLRRAASRDDRPRQSSARASTCRGCGHSCICS